MASLLKRGDTFHLVWYEGRTKRRKSLKTDSVQVAKERLRQFESARFRGDDCPLPTRTPVGEVVSAFIDHMRAHRPERSWRKDLTHLREAFGECCPALELDTTRARKARALRCPEEGRSAFLMLSGPSLKQIDLSLLDARGIVTMAVNNAWSVRRPTLWTCVDDPGRFIDVGWKDPGILKFVPTCMWDKRLKVMNPDGTLRNSAFKVHQMPGVLFFRRSDHFDHERFLTGDTISWGNDEKNPDSLGITGKRSVMLVALRLLHYLGFSTVYLLGCDFKMNVERKYAFDEHRAANAIRHNNVLYDSLSRRFEALKPHFEKHRFRVVNCSPGSALEVFEKMAFEDAVKAAASECGKPIRTDGWYEPNPKASAPPQEAAR